MITISPAGDINGYGKHQDTPQKKKLKTNSNDFAAHMEKATRAKRELNAMEQNAYRKIEAKYIYNLYAMHQLRNRMETVQ